MIKINLLRNSQKGQSNDTSVEVESSAEEKQQQRQQVLIRALIIIGFPMLLYFVEIFSLPGKRQQLAAKQSELSELTNFNSQVETKKEEIKQEKDKLAATLARLDLLKKNVLGRTSGIRSLEYIQQVMPQKLWLSDISVNEDKMSIKGYALTDAEISNFMESLSKTPLFVEVSLAGTGEATSTAMPGGSANLREFTISCLLEK